MIEASHKTNDNVKEGAGVVSELKEQSRERCRCESGDGGCDQKPDR